MTPRRWGPGLLLLALLGCGITTGGCNHDGTAPRLAATDPSPAAAQSPPALIASPPPSTLPSPTRTDIPQADAWERVKYFDMLRAHKYGTLRDRFADLTWKLPSSSLRHALYGSALIDCGSDRDGQGELAAALRIDPHCAPALLAQGNLAAFGGDLAKARSYYTQGKQAARMPFDQAVAVSSLADVDFWEGDLERARSGYEQALPLAQGYPVLRGRFYQQLALIAELEHKPDRVVEMLRHGFIDEDRLGPFTQLIEYGLVTSQPRLIEHVDLSRLPEGDPTSTLAHYTLRLLVRNDLLAGRLREAVERAYPLYTDTRLAWPVDIANVILALRTTRPHLGMQLKPLDNDPANLAYAALFGGDLIKASAYLKRCAREAPHSQRAQLYRITLELVQGHDQAAESLAKQYLQSDASIPTFTCYLNVLQKNQRWATILQTVHPRIIPIQSLVVLRAMICSMEGAELRKQAIPVAFLSERNIGPGPEHVVLWRRLYRPNEALPKGTTRDWETW